MTSGLKFLVFTAAVLVACATTRSDQLPPTASPAPAAGGRPELQSEPRLTPQEETALRAELAKCQKFAGLAHHIAEARALEERRATHGTDPRFEQCLAIFRELADGETTLDEDDLRGRDCVHEIAQGAAGNDVRGVVKCVESTVEDIDHSVRKLQALVRNEELRPAHDQCLAWLDLDERFFRATNLWCQEIEDTLTRQGSGNGK